MHKAKEQEPPIILNYEEESTERKETEPPYNSKPILYNMDEINDYNLIDQLDFKIEHKIGFI